MTKTCCGAGGGGKLDARDAAYLAAAQSVPPAAEATRQQLSSALIPLKGGFFDMGARRSRFPEDLDAPRRKVKLSPFRIAATACSNAEFARFVTETGYRSVAEAEGWSYVFHLLLAEPERWTEAPASVPWWRKVDGAFWAAPEGPGSDLAGREDHPVVHVCWYDALAYCTWAGLRLPSEAQWEYAARGGLARRKFPWGDAFWPGGRPAMNTWQGEFPMVNTGEDGFVGTAPVTAYSPNGYGVYNMCGNVWEWTQDLFGSEPVSGPFPLRDPTGPAQGYARVQRGGSYLCHVSYCDRYHVHSRTRNDPESSTGHIGFRVAAAG
ncbi:Formylglycine-generating enzyme, required for sulfatase activity, contains SUMF1/FGE domain [Paracoccus isoporae]|uniref:Formylglycine-generating enzyme, required for sulfatase activity, contains SUMF1/FGE domain n=1 Tax=Paracoccus isoporae TaxID=591205 RepID=A0A1G6U4Z2_9RHOB|nr:formylglycine-generating enzyme family protein [Paracoccus isoporae]SDD36363.1 Formylglycine-generating enzyme, required for sulfatase activity, contains SUMF1/FGE domain [Paracoccus isoporae]